MSELFELVYQLMDSDIQVRCPFSKDSLNALVQENCISTPSIEEIPEWFPSIFRQDQYCICASDFEIHEGDIIIKDNIRFQISAIYFEDDEQYYHQNKKKYCRILLKNIDSEEYIQMSSTRFMKLIEGNNVVYERSLYLDCN